MFVAHSTKFKCTVGIAFLPFIMSFISENLNTFATQFIRCGSGLVILGKTIERHEHGTRTLITLPRYSVHEEGKEKEPEVIRV